MRCSIAVSCVFAALAVTEVLASPAHVNLHRKLHKKRDLNTVNWEALDWHNMGIDWAEAYAKGQAASSDKPADPAASPEAAPSDTVEVPPPAAPKADPPKSNQSNGVAAASFSEIDSSTTFTGTAAGSDLLGSSHPDHGSSTALWNNLVGASNHRKSFGLSTPTKGLEVGYVSNVGIPEGSNMIKAESANDHVFTNEFINTSKESMTVVIWNKAASKGLEDPLQADPNLGASIAPEHPALTLALAPGQSQVVAFLDQSVVGWAQACDERAQSGGFSTTWGEAQFNTTGSGYDVSAIQNPHGSNYVMDISSVEANSCDSTESENMWVTDTNTVGSGSCYIAQGTAHLTTKMGGFSS